MSKAPSLDLRVLEAVVEGLSHRASAARFGASVARVSRRHSRARVGGAPRSRALGGDRRSGHTSEQDRPDVLERRQVWRESQTALNAARLVLIDEARARSNMSRTHGRALKGRRRTPVPAVPIPTRSRWPSPSARLPNAPQRACTGLSPASNPGNAETASLPPGYDPT